MEALNDTESEIYKNTLKKQKLYIANRLKTIRNKYLNDTMGCCGEKEIIAKHLNNGPAQNLINSFFKFKEKYCVICNLKVGDSEIKQMERAHCNLYSRYDLLLMAINEIYIDVSTPIIVGDILRLFIQKHEICPIYILCNKCHLKYDRSK